VSEEIISFEFNVVGAKEVYWEGITTKSANNFEPRSKMQIQLNAVLFNYGTYNLNQFLFVVYKDSKSTTHTIKGEVLVNISLPA